MKGQSDHIFVSLQEKFFPFGSNQSREVTIDQMIWNGIGDLGIFWNIGNSHPLGLMYDLRPLLNMVVFHEERMLHNVLTN